MTLKKSGRGSVGREFRRIKRTQEDNEYKKKRFTMQKNYSKKNREKIRKYHKKWSEVLDKFANKRCEDKDCNKLLNYRTTSGFCRKHRPKHQR